MTSLLLQVYLLSLALTVSSLYLTYYGPFRTAFWTQRYRCVDVAPGGAEGAGDVVDHVGPALELGFTLVLASGTLFLAVVVFPDTTAALVRHPRFGPVSLGVVGVLAVVVGVICFFASPREHDGMIQRQEGAFDGLPPGTVRRIVKALDGLTPDGVREECRRNRRIYLPYFFYSLNNAVLVAAFAVVTYAGLAAGWSQWHQAESHLAATRVAADAASISESFFHDAQLLLGRYATFQDRLLEFARSLLAVVAAFVLVLYWMAGTSFPLIYTRGVVRLGRLLARVALVVLALVIGYGYADMAAEAERVNAQVGEVVLAVDLFALPIDVLERLNDLRFTVSNEATVDDFWARLVNSYGGLMLLVGGLVGFLRQQATGTSFLGSLLPQPQRSRYLQAVLSVRDESGWAAAPEADAGDDP